MSHISSFIEFQRQTPHDDAFEILWRGVDSRVWLNKDRTSVIKEYNTCHTRLSHDTLKQYHAIQTQAAADTDTLTINLPKEIKLLGKSVQSVSVRILELSQDMIYYTPPTKSMRSWLLTEVPFITGLTLHQVIQQETEQQDVLELEHNVKVALRATWVPVYLSPENPGFALTRENIRLVDVSDDRAHFMITDLGWSIWEMVRSVLCKN